MKTLLIVTAVLEAATGLGLALAPALTVFMLFGASLDTPDGLMVGRVAGRRSSHWVSPAGWRSMTNRAAPRKG
jgi:hypothetical protein